MKKLLALLILIPLLAQAAPYDVLLKQRDNVDASTKDRAMTPPGGGGQNAIMGYNGASNLPAFLGIGPGLSLSSGLLSGFSGAYADLTGTPTVFAPAAHVHPISQVTGLQTALDGKLATPGGTTAQYLRGDGTLAAFPALFNGAYASLTGIPATFAPAAHTQAWSTITATPTTLGGYGITDAATSAQLATKFTIPTGTTAQYVRGDGSLATLPTAKRIESYVGVTDANGLYTVTYPTAFPAVPSVQPGPPSDSTQSWVLVTSTTTGFSVRLVQRGVLTVLSVQVLAGVVSNVAAAPAQVLVVAQ